MNHKHVERCDEEENQRVSPQSISQALPARCLAEFPHRQGPDVSRAAPVQITGGSMMQRMLPSPVHVGGQVDKPRNGARHVVGHTVFEKREGPQLWNMKNFRARNPAARMAMGNISQ